MNTRTIRWVAAGLAGMLTLVVLCSGFLSPSQVVEAVDPEIAQAILEYTFQIRLFAPLPVEGQADASNQAYVMAQGLGSLVSWQGANVIVTHNHWGGMLASAEYAHILDAQGNLLLKLGMAEFKDLVLYTDPGTLVLAAPAGLPAAITIDEEVAPAAGDVVILVHQSTTDPNQLDLLQAQVVKHQEYKGQLVYKLALVDDGQIIPGDSGGGIWLNGQLVGNMWASYFETVRLPFSAETSLAASLPYFQSADTNNSESVSLVEPSPNGPSDLATAE